jgi:hypothetical protein
MLNDYIEIDREHTQNHCTKFPNINFHLDRERLYKIQKDRAKHRSLKLSRSLLLKFRYQVLVDRQNFLHSGLTFCTYYPYNNNKKVAFKSIVFLDGQVNLQICQDFLEDPELAKQIISSHYWLSEQLLKNMGLKNKIKTNFGLWFLSFSLASVAMFSYFNHQIFSINIINYSIVIAICLLSQQVIKSFRQFFLPNLRAWFLNQLLFGIFSDRLKNKNIVFKILHWIGL